MRRAVVRTLQIAVWAWSLCLMCCGLPHPGAGGIDGRQESGTERAPENTLALGIAVSDGPTTPDSAAEGMVEEVPVEEDPEPVMPEETDPPPMGVPQGPRPMAPGVCDSFTSCWDAVQCCNQRDEASEQTCCEKGSEPICWWEENGDLILYCSPSPETDCMNGIDDNGNGLTDCDDLDCRGAACDADNLDLTCCPGLGCVPGGGFE